MNSSSESDKSSSEKSIQLEFSSFSIIERFEISLRLQSESMKDEISNLSLGSLILISFCLPSENGCSGDDIVIFRYSFEWFFNLIFFLK